jgi:ATP-dependent RNA helicase RhlE
MAARDALFDAPYEPSSAPRPASEIAAVRAAPKKQVAALFRTPVKTDNAGQ